MLIRNYYRKTSAIEIFTYKSNKSYYFNFKDIIDFDNLKNNIILKEISENENFIKYDFKKEIIVYYNKAYESTMFPFLYKQFQWKSKILFYNNYDLLTIINLVSNRSFKDLYQYPIFPILYKPNNILENNKERDLSEHLGIQDLTEKSKARKELIEDSYNIYKANYTPETEEEGEDNSPSLFNTHY